MHWREESAHPADYDPNDEDTHTQAVTNQQREIDAFVHYVNYSSTGQVRYAGIESGNVIIDIDSEIVVEELRDVRFEIKGKMYVQRRLGKEIAECFDVLAGDVIVGKTLLLEVHGRRP